MLIMVVNAHWSAGAEMTLHRFTVHRAQAMHTGGPPMPTASSLEYLSHSVWLLLKSMQVFWPKRCEQVRPYQTEGFWNALWDGAVAMENWDSEISCTVIGKRGEFKALQNLTMMSGWPQETRGVQVTNLGLSGSSVPPALITFGHSQAKEHLPHRL